MAKYNYPEGATKEQKARIRRHERNGAKSMTRWDRANQVLSETLSTTTENEVREKTSTEEKS